MQRLIKFLPVLLLLFVISCTQEEIVQDNQTNGLSASDPVIQKIVEMGYNLSEIEEIEDYYLVQGDIMFPKDLSAYESTNARHAHTNNLVSWNRVYTVRVDGSIPSSGVDNWRAATINAINDWNNITNCAISFQYTTSGSADVVVRSDFGSLGNNVIASAGFPFSSGAPYNTVMVNLDFSFNTTVSESSKRYNMVHELGHAVGFRHTNWDIRGEGTAGVGANLVPGTPSQDPNSVMNGGTANFSWAGFSTYDLVAARYMYPQTTPANFDFNLDYVTTYESRDYEDDVEEQDVFIEFTQPGTSTSYTLQSARTVTYDIETYVEARYPYTTTRSYTRTLQPGSSRYFLDDIVRFECYYDYGNPIEPCRSQRVRNVQVQ